MNAAPSVEEAIGGPRPAWAAFLPDWFVRWAPPVTIAAAFMSLLTHLVLAVIAAIIYVGGAQAGGAGDGGEGGGGVGVAVMTEAELGEIQSAGLDAEAPAVPEISPTTLPGGDEDLGVPEIAGAGGAEGGLADGLGGLTSGLGAGNISGGPGLGAGGSGGGAASFFGVEARGTRFIYICDVSGSMDATVGNGTTRRIDILKVELLRSLEELLEKAHFFVCLFSSDAQPLGNRMEWIVASDAGKQWARRTIPLIVAQGGTEPMNAFRVALSLRPRADAIYFMTDGEFAEEYATQIANMNADYKIPIHCITFVSREGESTMKRIAAESGGTYTHVPGPGGG